MSLVEKAIQDRRKALDKMKEAHDTNDRPSFDLWYNMFNCHVNYLQRKGIETPKELFDEVHKYHGFFYKPIQNFDGSKEEYTW